MPLEITILPEDVETAISYKLKSGPAYYSWSAHCPIAEAAHRITGVDYEKIYISGTRYAVIDGVDYTLPRQAQEYISDVDHYLHRGGLGFAPYKVEAGKTFILEEATW